MRLTTTATTRILGLLAVALSWPSASASAAAAAAAAASGPLLNARQSSTVEQKNVTVQEGGISTTFALPLRAAPNVVPGTPIRSDTELRILCIGDSITVGYGSSSRDGYREGLKANLAGDDVVFAGTEQGGAMDDGYFGAWSGQTIQFMSNHIDASLAQLPNVVLLHAGTNDMNPRPDVSLQGSDPARAADRLGLLIDKITAAVPDAVVLVAVIINSCAPIQQTNVRDYQALVPGVVRPRLEAGRRVLAVDFSELGDAVLSMDCIHPSNEGYELMADQWYNFMTQVPPAWIRPPIGEDPVRPATKSVDTPGAQADGGGGGGDGFAGGGAANAAVLGSSTPFWAPTAAAAAWHLVSWMTTA